MQWFVDNLGTIVVALIVAAVVGLIIFFHFRNKKKGGTGCGCGCADCPMRDKCGGK